MKIFLTNEWSSPRTTTHEKNKKKQQQSVKNKIAIFNFRSYQIYQGLSIYNQ